MTLRIFPIRDDAIREIEKARRELYCLCLYSEENTETEQGPGFSRSRLSPFFYKALSLSSDEKIEKMSVKDLNLTLASLKKMLKNAKNFSDSP